ncbi:hypothetical protein DICPUDRAFT_158303 [Dictyostelium purpureum]|uniref:SNF2-related domain-containing protein n=1 Tax=Dictyostelium purpureum TaxID=5786 RepID=F1A199_DICPU|nr:uncharacterized protein DICPUDRAFT_158303 [Dictyostelium purpureum]EGC30034.1 hypothetical protein DICPUDRAFT_158303 [Dictyostelium purpureum]|eukprot:XP_003293445.1 hypothetical protein DICPUDRAFT_158303 [Dictyostelium purpureum]
MVVLENRRTRIQRTDISKSFIKNESEEEEEIESNDDSDYEDQAEESEESESEHLDLDESEDDNSDEDYSDGESIKKNSKKPPSSRSKPTAKPTVVKKTTNGKKLAAKDSDDDSDDFCLPKSKKKTTVDKEKELMESKLVYEQTLKQASMDQWILKKPNNEKEKTEPSRFFSFAKKSSTTTTTSTAATTAAATTTTTSPNKTNNGTPQILRLASIKNTHRPLGMGNSSEKNDFFSNFLYNKSTGKSKEESIKIEDEGEKIEEEEKENKKEEEEDDSLFGKGFNSPKFNATSVKNHVQKMVKDSLSESDTEDEELPLVNKKRKEGKDASQQKKTMVIEISDKEDDSDTEEESEPKSKNKKSVTTTIDSDNETVEIPDEEEEEEGSRNIDDEPTIEKLIYACECFSKRMLEILSNSDLEEKKLTTTTTTSINKKTTDKNKLITQPKTINKTMRNYQLIGLNWMAVLYKENINGILADEMGLGKTVQTISVLAHIMETYNDCGPHLIIVPATVMSNWGRELETWCPTLKVIRYYGNIKEREELRYDIRKMKPKKDFHIILTTYNLLFSNLDRAFLKKFDYSYLILDEAQNIKNSDSRRYKNIFKIQSKHRLLLTGTPLQNNLYELWSLLNFLMPHIFGSTSKNNYLLNQLLEYKGDDSDSALSRMKKILSPFILRRLKSTVSKELKPKKEIIERCVMPEFQQNTYNTVIKRSKAQWANRDLIKQKEDTKKRKKKSTSLLDPDCDLLDLTIDDSVVENGNGEEKLTAKQKELAKQIKQGNGSFVLNNILMQLRKASNHPLLCKNIFYTEEQIDDIVKTLARNDKEWIEYRYDVPALKELFQSFSDYEVFKNICENPLLADKYWIDDEQFYETSAKCIKLKEILQKEIHENKSKVLIFSQMTKVLDILEDVLSIFGESFTRLDGQTPVNERQDIIDHFTNSKDIPVFLLSTNAGGLGINLTCANVVIFYDLSFNPQVDRQAEDRAHRLGQEREVIVYKLLTENTVDIDIFNSANEKKKLNDNILEEGTYTEKETKLESKKILKILDSIFT